MTVYACLRLVEYEGSTLHAIFSTNGAADEFCANQQQVGGWNSQPEPDYVTWVVEPMVVDLHL